MSKGESQIRIRGRTLILKFPWREVVLLAAILVVGLPSLFVNWMIVDDGYYLFIEQKISSLIASLNFSGLGDVLIEPDRFRPALRIYLWLTYLIAGQNPLLHHLINFLISGATVILIYSIIRILTSSKSAALVGGLLFTLASFNIENWYRLKTPEPKITFFIALSLFFLVKNLQNIYATGKSKNSFLVFSTLPLVFAYFIRETSFAFFPFSLFLFAGALHFKNNNKRKRVWLKTAAIFFAVNFVLAIIPLAINIFLRKQGSYTSYYDVAPSKMLSIGWLYLKLMIRELSPFPLLLGFSFLISWFWLLRSRRVTFERFLQLAFLVAFASFLVALLPWGIPLGRYLELVLLFLSLVLGLEAYAILKIKPVKSHWKFFIFLAGFAILVFNNGCSMYNYARDTILGQRNINKTLLYLAAQTPKNGKILWNLKENEGTVELVMEANFLLNLVYNRPDLVIEYLNDDALKKLAGEDLVMSAIVYQKDQFYKEDELLKNKPLKLVKILPHEIQKISFNLPLVRMWRLVLLVAPRPQRPLFEMSTFRTRWKIYQVI